MENRSAIWIFTVLLILACLYQLSFNYVASNFEAEADAVCEGLSADSTLTKSQCKTQYLSEHGSDTIYPIMNHTYSHCKEQQLNLGLDLQGGMSATLEVSVPELVENLSAKYSGDSFKKAMSEARTAQASSGDDFITLFASAWDNNKPEGQDKLPGIFNNLDYTEKFKSAKTDDDVIDILRVEAETAIVNTEQIVRQRIDRLGVAQPNIQRQASTGRILLELAGVDNPERVKKLIGATAKLEFWPVAEVTEQVNGKQLAQYFAELDTIISSTNDPEAFQLELTTTENTPVVDPITNEPFKNSAGEDSIIVDIKTNDDVAKRRFPLRSVSQFVPAGGRSPIILTALKSDTGKVNKILSSKKPSGRLFIDDVLPNNYFTMWSAKPFTATGGQEAFNLYVLRDDSRRRKAELDGSSITDAEQNFDQYGKIITSMTMNSDGAQTWAAMTKLASSGDPERPKKQIAITLDNHVYSSPSVEDEIPNGTSRITMGGEDTSYNEKLTEAQDLANLLEAGSLPAPAKIVNSDVVGPSLGQKNIDAGKWSFIIALLVIMAYMILLL